MQNIILVAVGGALGASSRYLLSTCIVRYFSLTMPWAIFGINVIGSFFLGLLMGWLAFRGQNGQEWRLFLCTGVLGGFTTFSTFALDIVTMIEKKAYTQALSYSLGSLIIAALAAFAGLILARKVFAI